LLTDGDDVWLVRNGFGVGAREVHAAPSGLGVFFGPFPRALPWAITLCPFGAEDRCGAGDEDRCDVGARELHSAPSGLGGFTRPFTQGFALGYRIVPRWGGRPVHRWGRKTGAPMGAKIGATMGRNTGAALGAKIGASG
jgi:hypothetical protein